MTNQWKVPGLQYILSTPTALFESDSASCFCKRLMIVSPLRHLRNKCWQMFWQICYTDLGGVQNVILFSKQQNQLLVSSSVTLNTALCHCTRKWFAQYSGSGKVACFCLRKASQPEEGCSCLAQGHFCCL